LNRVVVADDHRFFRSGVEAALTSCGFEIAASVGDGNQALDAIEAENPDLVFLDVRMPELDGVTLLERLRARHDRRPVIVLTAELLNDDLVRLMRAGVDSIVFKHEPESHLCEAIKSVQQGKRHIPGELLDRAFATTASGGAPSPLDALSTKERQIALEVGQGKRNREIGEKLGLKEGSVKVYLHHIYNKLGISNRTELALIVREAQPN
jgi:two-component system nitrate/nitrite response regulator NarL